MTESENLDGSRAPLVDHLIKLRSRLLRAFLALAVAFGVSIYFAKPIFTVLVQPLIHTGQDRLIYMQLFERSSSKSRWHSSQRS